MRIRPLPFLLLALAAQALPAQQADALQLYRAGRELESAGNESAAAAKYAQAVDICNQELQAAPGRIDSYVVKDWSLLRLKKYSDVISVGQAGLKVSADMRLVEVMGEAYYYLDDMASCLTYLQRYADNVPETADRLATAYFFMGEAYLRLKQWDHADIAYTMAVYQEPSMPRWWYRLGVARENKGDLKRALAAYEKAVALSPTSADIVAARDRVKAKAQ